MAQTKDISVLEMLQAGVHFGHKTSKKHPKMNPFVFGARNGISIIDLEKTKQQLTKVLPILEDLAAQNKVILLVGSKRQAQTTVKALAEELHMPYLVDRWIGGLLTNFTSVSRLMRKLTQLKEERDQGTWEKRYTKKEQLVLTREIERLEHLVGGIETMAKLPDAIVVADCNKDKTAVIEAARLKIPVFAITDTNVNPDLVNYPIPANDDGIKSIQYIFAILREALLAGQVRAAAAAVQPAAPANITA
ncbi:MAG: 30S ribosomal protein S2 [Candidatus Kerfeldbacteria bacterium]|nr:30S ribosomal protein S2 [Candidatus Kerfeldbacteria bacterium]